MNKYLEKIASALSMAKGYAGLGKSFQAIDSAIGSGTRTIQKAMQSIKVSPMSYRKVLRDSAKEHKLSRKQMESIVRQQKNIVKNPGTRLETVSADGKREFQKIIPGGYKSNTTTVENNKYMNKINLKTEADRAKVDRINSARAKVGLAAGGVALAGGVGYTMGKRRGEENISQPVYTLPY